MKKILFLMFAVLMTAITSSCNNRKINCDDLTFIKQDTTVLVYYEGKPFNGIAFIEGTKGTQILIDEGKFFCITKFVGREIVADIYANHSNYYDKSGNFISKELFDKLYPDVTLTTYDDILKLCK